jgi:hypothetical protein
LRKGYIADKASTEVMRKSLKEWSRIANYTNNGAVFEATVHSFLSQYPSCLDCSKMEALGGSMAMLPQWPKKGARWNLVQLAPATRAKLCSGTYYYMRDMNFPLIDSFWFHHEGNAKVASLVCFQMTIAKGHQPTYAAVDKFISLMNDRFYSSRGDTDLVTVNDVGGLSLRGNVTLKMFVVYVLSHETFAGFGKQSLPKEPGLAKGAKKIERLWKLVQQVKSYPPVMVA